MTNHNIPENRHENPLHMTEKGRNIVKGTFIALGGMAIAYGATHNAAAGSGVQLDHLDKAPSSILNQSVYEHGPIDPAHSITSVIKEGDATSIVVEKAVIQLAEKEHLKLKQGQSAVNHESSRYIEDVTQELTGGTVQPGDIIESWQDPTTGFVVSTRVIENTK